MNELLLILLPLAAYTGWWLAKSDRGGRHDVGQSDAYFRGLDYLLNDDTDNAISTFTELARVNTKATNQRDIQHCITLGRLLRKRGEVDRALHLHQSLLSGIKRNPSAFPDDLIVKIHLSLGDDFNDAGIMNRAISHYQSAFEQGALDVQRMAGQKLFHLHARQHSWQDAIAVSEQLDQATFLTLDKHIAHCHCELAAETASIENQSVAGTQHLNQALKVGQNCIRAHVMLAERAMAQSQFITAIGHYKAIDQCSPRAMMACLPDMQRAFVSLNQESEWRSYLDDLYRRCPHPSVALMLSERLSDEASRDFLKSILTEHPSFRVLSEYLSETDESLSQVVQRLSGKNQALMFKCETCGFRTASQQWQCPGCGALETLMLD